MLEQALVRPQLLDRQQRLRQAVAATPERPDLAQLLEQVDSALSRIDAGSYGMCRTCGDPVEPDRLLQNPLAQFCLDHLSHDEARAHERDIELAARIQRGLLPPARVEAAGWEIATRYIPAGAVSGDFCDVVPGASGHDIVLLFGDVSGKGVAAGLLMGQLRAIFRSLLEEAIPVAELVQDLNRLFRDSALPPHFATLVCGRASASGVLELVNAGHCPPLHLTASEAKAIDPTGFPVGVFYSSSYRATSLALAPGDTLLVYTDGLTEARNRHDAEYGPARVAEVASRLSRATPDEILDGCLADLASFLDGVPRRDDLTMMAVRRRA